MLESLKSRLAAVGLASMGSLIACIVGFQTQAVANTNAVALHEASGLSAQVTTWCLGNEAEFLVAAEGLGIDFKRGTNGTLGIQAPEGGSFGSLYDWAKSRETEALASFDSACRLAYAAFSRSEARPDESEAFYESDGFIGTIVGAGVAGLFGLFGGTWRARKDAANELIDASNRFGNAMSTFLQPENTEKTPDDAEAAARQLLAVFVKWRFLSGQERNVSLAMDHLRAILGESSERQKWSLRNFGEAGDNREAAAKSLTDTALEVQSIAASVSRRIRSVGRLPYRLTEGVHRKIEGS